MIIFYTVTELWFVIFVNTRWNILDNSLATECIWKYDNREPAADKRFFLFVQIKQWTRKGPCIENIVSLGLTKHI